MTVKLPGFTMRAGTFSAWALLAGAGLPACSDEGIRGSAPPGGPTPPVACTEIGCADGLKVALSPVSGWPEGDYLFRIRADARETTCRGTLPLASCTETNVLCEGESLATIVESGCAVPASTQAFPGIYFEPSLRPDEVEITVSHDGRVVGRSRFEPTFRRVQPNGPECPPVCELADAVLRLEF